MAGLIGDLVHILNQEAKFYGTLLEYSKQKTQLIIENKVQELRTQTELEEKVIRDIAKLEIQREEIIKKVAAVLQVSHKELKISDLIPVLEKAPEDQRELQKAQEGMVSILEELQRSNEQNKRLIESSLDYIDFSINLIHSASSVSQNNYTKGGTEAYGEQEGQSYFDFKR